MTIKLPIVEESPAEFPLAAVFTAVGCGTGWAWWQGLDWLGGWSLWVWGGATLVAALMTCISLIETLLVVSADGLTHRVRFLGLPLKHEREPISRYRLQWVTFGDDDAQEGGEAQFGMLFIGWRHKPELRHVIGSISQHSHAQALAALLDTALVGNDAQPDRRALAATKPPAHIALKRQPQGLLIRRRLPFVVLAARGCMILGVPAFALELFAGLGERYPLGAVGIGLILIGAAFYVISAYTDGSRYTRKEQVLWRPDRVEFRRRGAVWQVAPQDLTHIDTCSLGKKYNWWSRLYHEEYAVVVETAEERQTWFRSADLEMVHWVAAALVAARDGSPIGV